MPKGQKRKTTVRKKKKSSTSKKKPIARKKKSNEPLLEKAAADVVAAEEAIAALEDKSIAMEEDTLRIEDFTDVSQERASILSIVRGLEGQVETAFKLKEVLEDELDITQKKLSEELEVRVQLDAQVKSLEAQAALAEQLREDIAFVEEERNKFADQLEQIEPQFESVTDERDSLAEQLVSAEEHTKVLESEKIALEAQVMNMKDRVTDSDRLNRKLSDVTEANQEIRGQSHDLSRRLETSETSNEALEMELSGAHQTAQNLREEMESLRDKVAATDDRSTDMRIQFEDQQAMNRELLQAKTRLENEVKMLSIKYEAAKNELNAFKSALRDIRSEATRTSGRVRQRYLKPNNGGTSNQTVSSNSSRRRSQSLSGKG